MSQYKDRNKYKELLGKWNVCCDRSGFIFDNTEVIRDHRNRIVAKQYADPIHWTERQVHIPVENNKLPFCRPIIQPTEASPRRLPWSKLHIKWSDLHRKWSDPY